MKKITLATLLFSLSMLASLHVFAQTRDLLTPEETLWLKERNNTIVVYPEQNNPPYSYQNPSGNIQGLSIDYIELVAEKIGAKIQYLTPRSRAQISTEIQSGKGDVAFFTPDVTTEDNLIFTESYATVPVVIVVRKDADKRNGLTLNDFNGKRVAMVDGSAVEKYVSKNYPRVVRDGVTDDEVGLQQVVLGEVDAAIMDVASLSYYLSKQVLSSVKIVGNTGLDYKPSFALTKNKAILQSILEKGLSQIGVNDRGILVDKWIALPGEVQSQDSSIWSILKNNLGTVTIYGLFGVGILTIIVLLLTKKSHRDRYFEKVHNVKDLKEEFTELEGESQELTRELEQVKLEEEKLKEKLKTLGE
ncbi:MAG: transporter substrate-binding domain-containing protein [Candidatus Pacebacteria bacterium]|nr:transporter substrate-binding domain-containing protein [Candidatus Paceibacterota bacterium]